MLRTYLPTIIGILAGICTTSAAVPQVIKIIRTRHTADISLIMYVLLSTGIFLWFLYGILLGDMPIIVANGFSLIIVTTVLILKIRHG
jgi:MtN3 and saliva related transmembrane protein